MDSPSPGLETLLARLAASGTEFVLVGALAAVAQGALLGTGHQLLSTASLGQLDVRGAIEGGREFPTSSARASRPGRAAEVVRVLSASRTLAELKRGATDAKGRLALAVLEATLRRAGGG